jgi:uncharacterized RDD family membrane protein YckC
MSVGSARGFYLETEEGVRIGLPLAGPVARCLAWFVDFGCKAVICLVVLIAMNMLSVFTGDTAGALAFLTVFLVTQGYNIVLEYFWRGTTIGKRLLRLRVMDEEGLPLTFSQVVLRNLLRAVDTLPLFYSVGGIAMVLSPRAQRLGDLAATTIVVHVRDQLQYDLSRVEENRYNSLRAYPFLEARLRRKAPPELAALAVRSLNRRATLDPDARLALMRELAEGFRACVAFPEEATAGMTDEQFVRNCVESLFVGGGR